MQRTTAKLIRDMLTKEPNGLVFTLGDNWHKSAVNEYASTWGHFRERTFPTIGNHDRYRCDGEGRLGNADPYRDYFDDRFPEFDKGQFFYVRDFEHSPWSIIVLDTTYYENSSPTGAVNHYEEWGNKECCWLQETLEAETRANRGVVVMWHHPVCRTCCKSKLSDEGCDDDAKAHGTNLGINPCTCECGVDPFDLALRKRLWKIMYGKVSLVLAGHEHLYRRFIPLNRELEKPKTGEKGLTQIVIGTGGADPHCPCGDPAHPCPDQHECDFPWNKEVYSNGGGEIQHDEIQDGGTEKERLFWNTYGVLRLDLRPSPKRGKRPYGAYQFIPTPGSPPDHKDEGRFECVTCSVSD
jgi:hypothetical protein